MTLRSARILVADDQRDVAETLCRPLEKAGATIEFVGSGTEALAALVVGGFDLCIVDMKMPPDPWGGLWFLEELRRRLLHTPCLVLSGEGTQRQTIEALRLGARDWIDKGSAGSELVDRCVVAVDEARAAGMTTVVSQSPSPIAFAFARYNKSIRTGRQFDEGIHALEEVVRFAALVGLASCAGDVQGPVVPATRMARPSFGGWSDVLRRLQQRPQMPASFRTLAGLLISGGQGRIDTFVKLRNDLHHGGEPGVEQTAGLDLLLHTWAARLSTGWPYRIVSPVGMKYDGDEYEVTAEEHCGTSGVKTVVFGSQEPLLDAAPYLLDPTGDAVPLYPWLAVKPTESGQRAALVVWDGVLQSKRDSFAASDPLIFYDPASGARRLRLEGSRYAWAEVRAWFE